jgi:hypothetical protein
MLRSALLACLAFASLAAMPQLASADLCREVEVNDRIVIRCFSCRSPDTFEERAACDEVCSDPELRRQESSCPLSDEERRRAPPCRDDEVRGPDGTCSQVRCGVDERVENGRCVPGACEPGRVLSPDGECVKPPPLMCVDRATTTSLKAQIEEGEGLAETRLLNAISLAIAREIPVILPGGKTVSAGPDETTDDSLKLRASLEKFVKQQGEECTARPDLQTRNCATPIDTLIKAQNDGLGTIGEQIRQDLRRGMGLPMLDRCVEAKDSRTLEFKTLIDRGVAFSSRVIFINEFVETITRTPEVIQIECEKPDVTTCSIRIEGQPNPNDGRVMFGLVKKYLRKFGAAGATE